MIADCICAKGAITHDDSSTLVRARPTTTAVAATVSDMISRTNKARAVYFLRGRLSHVPADGALAARRDSRSLIGVYDARATIRMISEDIVAALGACASNA